MFVVKKKIEIRSKREKKEKSEEKKETKRDLRVISMKKKENEIFILFIGTFYGSEIREWCEKKNCFCDL